MIPGTGLQGWVPLPLGRVKGQGGGGERALPDHTDSLNTPSRPSPVEGEGENQPLIEAFHPSRGRRKTRAVVAALRYVQKALLWFKENGHFAKKEESQESEVSYEYPTNALHG